LTACSPLLEHDRGAVDLGHRRRLGLVGLKLSGSANEHAVGRKAMRPFQRLIYTSVTTRSTRVSSSTGKNLLTMATELARSRNSSVATDDLLSADGAHCRAPCVRTTAADLGFTWCAAPPQARSPICLPRVPRTSSSRPRDLGRLHRHRGRCRVGDRPPMYPSSFGLRELRRR